MNRRPGYKWEVVFNISMAITIVSSAVCFVATIVSIVQRHLAQ